MGSCICLRKSDLIVENDVVVTALRHAPYKWAVINPRPSMARSIPRQQQEQARQCGLYQEILSKELSRPNSCPTTTEESYPLTCLEVLDSISQKSDLLHTELKIVQQEQEDVTSQDRFADGVSMQFGSPGSSFKSRSLLGGYDNDREERRLSSFSHTTTESFFSHGTAEFGESDESSRRGSPSLLQPDVPAAKCSQFYIKPVTRKRLFSPRIRKLRCSHRLSKRYWANEKESLLQRSPAVGAQQCKSLQYKLT